MFVAASWAGDAALRLGQVLALRWDLDHVSASVDARCDSKLATHSRRHQPNFSSMCTDCTNLLNSITLLDAGFTMPCLFLPLCIWLWICLERNPNCAQRCRRPSGYGGYGEFAHGGVGYHHRKQWRRSHQPVPRCALSIIRRFHAPLAM
jgi:hypothetical protein